MKHVKGPDFPTGGIIYGMEGVKSAMHYGRGRVVLRARLAPGGGRVVVTVHDTGLGIPANKRDRLFQPFSQVDGSLTRRAGGTGLGLVISHRLVVAFGGTLRVRSRVGRGSTFRVSLPLAPARVTEAA